MPAGADATSRRGRAGAAGRDPAAAAVARWAAAHAATVPVGDGPRSGPPTALPAAPEPTSAALVSCTEVKAFDVRVAGDDFEQAGALTLDWGTMPDGRPVLAVAGRDLPVRIWDPEGGAPLGEFAQPRNYFDSVAWGAGRDGEPLLAAGCQDGTARIWDPGTGELRQTLVHSRAEMNSFVRRVAWGRRADGTSVFATGGHDGIVRIWDPHTGQCLRTLSAHASNVQALAWGRPDGRLLLATGGEDGETGFGDGGDRGARRTDCYRRIWDPDTGQLVDGVAGHHGCVSSLAWGYPPYGRALLASASRDGTVRVCDARDERPRDVVLGSEATWALSADWAPLADGRTILAATSFDGLSLWDHTTSQLLYTEARDFKNAGCDDLRWRLDPAGRLLLAAPAADCLVHIWEVVLDPPARSPAAGDDGRPARERVTLRAARPSRVLDPPEEVTPDFGDVRAQGVRDADRVACATGADGRVLAALRSSADTLQILDVRTATLLRTITHPAYVRCVGLGAGDGGRLLLATGSHDHLARIWDPDSGDLLRTLSGHTDYVTMVAWGHRADGRPLLATSSHDGFARVWDPGTGELLHALGGHGPGQSSISGAAAAAWGYRADGTPLLATGGYDSMARIWDPGTGQLLHALAGHTGTVYAVAWDQQPGRPPLLASGSSDKTIRIWDPGTGDLLRTLTGHDNSPFELAWARLSDQRTLLASGGGDGTARIWDPETGAQLASVPSTSHDQQSIALAADAADDELLLLVVATGQQGPVRAWRIATGLAAEPDGAARQRQRPAIVGVGSTRPLLRLGRAGLWPPLGLLADLIELTAPDGLDADQANPASRAAATDAGTPPPPLCDPRLASLADEPGIGRLRELGWAPAARTALAALLASRLAIPERYQPPAEVPVDTLRDALADALAGVTRERDAEAPWQPPVSELRAAVAAVSDPAITLLRILGPAACAADPLLPVRLAHRVPELPALSRNELRLLAGAGTRPTAHGGDLAAGTLRYSPGTAGLARTGPFSRLLPTQLALPRDLMAVRLVENQLLYRQHRAPARPAPEPVTIILDTTAPTYGPAGHALRLAAHLIAAVLWDHDAHPCLVTLTRPDQAAELRTAADLIDVWASATLDDPAPALAAALRTAAAVGQPAVFCTHHHTPRDNGYAAGPATRLLTSHQPPEPAPRPPAARWHAHLPPDPSAGQLAEAVGLLLAAGTAGMPR